MSETLRKRRGCCSLLCGRPVVSRIAGFGLCDHHTRIALAIRDGTLAPAATPSPATQPKRGTKVRDGVCPCGVTFAYFSRGGIKRRWCESCRELYPRARRRRLERRQVA